MASAVRGDQTAVHGRALPVDEGATRMMKSGSGMVGCDQGKPKCSLAGIASAGNSDIQGDPSGNPSSPREWRAGAKRYGISPATVQKQRSCQTSTDARWH